MQFINNIVTFVRIDNNKTIDMASLLVEKIDLPRNVKPECIPALLDQAGVRYHEISCDTWKVSKNPPRVTFRIAHCSDRLILHFHIEDNEIRAVETEDLGRVWEDSCCEFFITPESETECYYNFECNCIGTLVARWGVPVPEKREASPKFVFDSVVRKSSLGTEPFPAVKTAKTWGLVEIIPVSAFYKHDLGSFDGQRMKGNFYKCGDMLSEPHFLSWAPIDNPVPMFHCPQFFGEIIFE